MRRQICLRLRIRKQVCSVDIVGPFPTTAEGYKYVLNSQDLFSKAVYSYKLRGLSQGEVTDVMRRFRMHWHEPLVEQPQRACVYLDNFASFRADLFLHVLESLDWDHRFCTPYKHATHPVERVQRTLLEQSRRLLLEAELPLSYWDFAYAYAVYLFNRTAPSI